MYLPSFTGLRQTIGFDEGVGIADIIDVSEEKTNIVAKGFLAPMNKLLILFHITNCYKKYYIFSKINLKSTRYCPMT